MSSHIQSFSRHPGTEKQGTSWERCKVCEAEWRAGEHHQHRDGCVFRQDPRMRIAKGTSYDGLMLDITQPDFPVEVTVSGDQSVLWVNIGPACVLRVCRIEKIEWFTPWRALAELAVRAERAESALAEARAAALEEAAMACEDEFRQALNERPGYRQNTISHGCIACAKAIRALAGRKGA